MAYRLLLSRPAAKELDALPRAACAGVLKRLRGLADDPLPAGCVKLDEGIFRIRIGEYRAVYSIMDDPKMVLVLRVARRSEKTYRRLPPA